MEMRLDDAVAGGGRGGDDAPVESDALIARTDNRHENNAVPPPLAPAHWSAANVACLKLCCTI